ncbi:MAG: tetratricopeptide repeat protein [Chloroflexi bacterium]|nr:tetratricopeptide repeat protein [Chloroflexota bacterium]
MSDLRLTADALTTREIEILRLIADGLSNQEIAHKLFLTQGTVKWYNTQIFNKLGVKNRTQAIARTRELGLLDGAVPAAPVVSAPIPPQPVPFIGRDSELKAIAALLADPTCRLLTLVGPGGMGKTALAIETAQRQTPAFPDGVYFVALAPLTAPDAMLPVIAGALGFQFNDSASPRQQLLAYLRDRHLLLVLDNFDELLSGAGLLVDMLQAAPRMKTLVTSRERLNVREEVVFRVEGMALPAPDIPAGENEAVQLFVQSARRARPEFQLDAVSLPDVARICQLVDGMPLGIVLAAAWIGMLSPAEIATEIAGSLDFLETDTRNVPPRHRSIRSVFDSTWNLLAEAERSAFARLSVFRGGFTREAAEQIAGASLRTLLTLTNKSLLRRDTNGRYGIHELLRQYAAEQLDGDAEPTRQAHSRYYLALLTQDDTRTFDKIEADFENIRTAWGWAAEHGQAEAIETTLRPLFRFCIHRSRFQDAEKLFDQVLQLADRQVIFLNATTRLHLREYRGKVRGLMGDFDGAVADLSFVRQAAHANGDSAWERELLIHLGQLYRKSGKGVEAIQHLGGVLQFARASGNRRAAADALYHLGTVAWDEGDNIQARAYHSEAAALYRQLGLRDVVGVQALHGLAEVLLMSGQPESACASFQESLNLALEIGDRSYEAENLSMIGWTALGTIGMADYSRALDSFSRALAFSEAAHLGWHTICSQVGLGLVYGAMGDYRQGFDRAQQGYRLAESFGNLRFMSMALDSLGQLYQDLNLYSRAEAAHARGRELALRSESTFWLPRLQANAAIDRLRQGDVHVAADLHEALDMALGRDQGMHAARCLEGLAELHLTLGQPERALEAARRLLELAQAGGLREMIAQAHRWAGEALLAAGSLPEAEAELKQAGALASDIGRVRLLWDVHTALVRLYVTQGHDEAGQLHQHAAREIVARIRHNLPDDDLRAGLPVL